MSGYDESMQQRFEQGGQKEVIPHFAEVLCDGLLEYRYPRDKGPLVACSTRLLERGEGYEHAVLQKLLKDEEPRCFVTGPDHGNVVQVIDENTLSRDESTSADGYVTNLSHVALVGKGADCPVVAFYDSEHHAIGLVHSGWKGTVADAPVKTLQMMRVCYATDARKVQVVISPSIKPEHYEVEGDVHLKFLAARDEKGAFRFPLAVESQFFLPTTKPKKLLLDVAGAITYRLLAQGIVRDNLLVSSHDTWSEKDLFHSARRDGPNLPANRMVVLLK